MRVFVIFFVILFLLYPIPYTLYPVYAHSQTEIIRITQKGFEPQEVTLDVNSTVIFLNEDIKGHWPASNTHPTHEIYPDFDPKKPINSGDSWSFKPNKVGKWKYHDHLSPHFRGTIIVTEEESVASGKTLEKSNSKPILPDMLKKLLSTISQVIGSVQSFLDTSKKFQQTDITDFDGLKDEEQIKSLEKLAKAQGAEQAWGFIKDHFKGQPGSSGNIHDLAHLAGGLIYQKTGLAGLKECSSEFSFGCYHGFLDRAFEKSLDNLGKAEEACKLLGRDGPSASCIHGIGHGVASFYQTSDLKGALASCQKLTTSGQQYCFDGVFMEFERAAPDSIYSNNDPYIPCSNLEQEFGLIYSFACGRNQPNVLMGRFGFSFDDVVKVCLGAPTEFKTACVDALGFTVAREANTAEGITVGCGRIGVEEFVARCSWAAAGELIFQEVSGWQDVAPRVCFSLIGSYRADCKAYLDNLMKQYNK